MLVRTATKSGPDKRQTQSSNSHTFEDLNVTQMKGIFLLYLVFGSLSILMLIIEIFNIINLNKKEKHCRKQHLISWNTDRRGSYWLMN